jgi:epoxyqueuosine reductase
VSLVDWLAQDGDDLRRRYDRLYVPRNDARYLKRNALLALGNVGLPDQRAVLDPYLESDDELLREHAEWAAARIAGRLVLPLEQASVADA